MGPSRGERWGFWIVVFLGSVFFAPVVPVLFVGRRRWQWYGGVPQPDKLRFLTRLGRAIFLVAAFLGSESVALNEFAAAIGRQDEHVASVVAGPVIGLLAVIVLADLVAQSGAMLGRAIFSRAG